MIKDLKALRFDDLGELRELAISEVKLAHREIIRIAKRLRNEGQILNNY